MKIRKNLTVVFRHFVVFCLLPKLNLVCQFLNHLESQNVVFLASNHKNFPAVIIKYGSIVLRKN